MTAAKRRRHILALLDEHSIAWYLDPEALTDYDECTKQNACGEAHINGSRGFVRVSHEPGASVDAYMTSLHEIGHLVMDGRGPRGWRSSFPGPTLELEARAWRWAIDHALDMTPAAWRSVRQHMLGYREAALSDNRFRYPVSFVKLLNEVDRCLL